MKSMSSMSDLGSIIARIEKRLTALGLSPRAASVASGMSPDAIRTIRRQHTRGVQKGISTRTAHALAVTLQTTPEWLLSELGPESSDTQASRVYSDKLPYHGVINPGVWIDHYLDGSEPEPSAVPPDPRYPTSSQFCLLVQGTSVNRIARDGEYLICVDTNLYQTPIRDGDLVIVSVVRPKEGLRQITARQVHTVGTATELHAASDDPRFANSNSPGRQPIVLGQKTKDTEVSVRGKVVGVFRQLK
jgi:SOS-response transcriptional repressor LexA